MTKSTTKRKKSTMLCAACSVPIEDQQRFCGKCQDRMSNAIQQGNDPADLAMAQLVQAPNV